MAKNFLHKAPPQEIGSPLPTITFSSNAMPKHSNCSLTCVYNILLNRLQGIPIRARMGPDKFVNNSQATSSKSGALFLQTIIDK